MPEPNLPSDIPFRTKQLVDDIDHIAPDGSEIRLLAQGQRGGLAHCTIHSETTTQAVKHKTVEELWYFLAGSGEIWRKQGDYDEVLAVSPGTSLTIPTNVHFQFRNLGDDPLTLLIVTMPLWPGPDEAVSVDNHWEPHC